MKREAIKGFLTDAEVTAEANTYRERGIGLFACPGYAADLRPLDEKRAAWFARPFREREFLVRLGRDRLRDDASPSPTTASPARRPVAHRARPRTSRRSRRACAVKRSASPDADPDGDPDPALRPFIEAMADLVIAKLFRREMP
jgi:hypothetical protein